MIWGYLVWLGVGGEGVELVLKSCFPKLARKLKFILKVLAFIFFGMVVIGLGGEIRDSNAERARLTAANEQLRNQDKEILSLIQENIKLRSENQPIKSITAEAFLSFDGTNFDFQRWTNKFLNDSLTFIANGPDAPLYNLKATKFEPIFIVIPTNKDPVLNGVNMKIRYDWEPLDEASIYTHESVSWIEKNNTSVSDLDKLRQKIWIVVESIRDGVKLKSATVTVTYNGTVQRKFTEFAFTNFIIELSEKQTR